jgi:hypothetical protein
MRYAQYDEFGRIACVGSAPDGSDISNLGRVMLDPPSDIDFNENYIFEGALKSRPSKPSSHHEWDWPTKSWLPNLDAAKAAKKAEIETERMQRINAPLIYDGKVLDADQAARDNLKAKLEEVRERTRLNMPMAPELLVWRDNANVTHSSPTIEAYHDWLAGYAVAMSDRGTRCYATAWHHKDTLGQLSVLEDITNYNLSQGWPE